MSAAQTATQGSVEPMRRPDHKAKRHSRPSKWTDRRARRDRQIREWTAFGTDLALMIALFPPLFMAADWLRYSL